MNLQYNKVDEYISSSNHIDVYQSRFFVHYFLFLLLILFLSGKIPEMMCCISPSGWGDSTQTKQK